MFPVPLHLSRHGGCPALAGAGRPTQDRTSAAGVILRLACVTALLFTVVSGRALAQGIGTMQVTARVLPAGPSRVALEETRAVTAAALREPWTLSTIRRTRLVRTRADLLAQGSRRTLVITLHYPHN
jgi:hypothetical protein